MLALWIVLGSIPCYFLTGILYARSKAVDCYRTAKSRAEQAWSTPRFVREYTTSGYRSRIAARVFFWPWFPVQAWFDRPMIERQARVDQLREDAKVWREKRRTGTPEEREMAGELARMCDEQADALKI